jgi:hypothetical protein
LGVAIFDARLQIEFWIELSGFKWLTHRCKFIETKGENYRPHDTKAWP